MTRTSVKTSFEVCIFTADFQYTVLYDLSCTSPREHEGTERDTEGVGCDMS